MTLLQQVERPHLSNSQPDFERSAETELLVTILPEYDREVSYGTLSERVGFFVSGASGPLTSARRILEREQKIVFETIAGVGLIRLTDPEKGKTIAKKNEKVNRAAGRAIKRFDAIEDFCGMPIGDQTQALLQKSKAEAAREMLKRKTHSTSHVAKVVNNLNDQLAQFRAMYPPNK